MPHMAKRKQTEPPKSAEPKKPNRKGKPLNVWVPPAMRDAIDLLAERNRRLVTTEVIIALEEYLTKAGLWPPKKE